MKMTSWHAAACVAMYVLGSLHTWLWGIDYKANVLVLRNEKVAAAQRYREQSKIFRQQVRTRF